MQYSGMRGKGGRGWGHRKGQGGKGQLGGIMKRTTIALLLVAALWAKPKPCNVVLPARYHCQLYFKSDDANWQLRADGVLDAGHATAGNVQFFSDASDSIIPPNSLMVMKKGSFCTLEP